jgi:hypothetical protein
VVWGLTYRFLEGFFELLGRPLRGGEVAAIGAEGDGTRGR